MPTKKLKSILTMHNKAKTKKNKKIPKPKVLFIMFQGSGTNPKDWNPPESKFLDRLKKIGSVYTYQDKIYNIHHYNKSNPDHKDFDSDINIDLEYVMPDTHIKMVYDDIQAKYKNINEYKFIPIGWSAGCMLALYFAQIYASQCINVVLLDPSGFTPNNMKNMIDIIYTSEKLNTIYPITNVKYKHLLQRLKTKHNINDLWKINGIQNYTRWKFMSKHLSNLIYPLLTLPFVNLQTTEGTEWSELFNNSVRKEEMKILKQHNPKNYKAIVFIDKTHYIFGTIQPAIKIIKEIKNIINTFYKHNDNHGLDNK